jgi:hypothetical protein
MDNSNIVSESHTTLYEHLPESVRKQVNSALLINGALIHDMEYILYNLRTFRRIHHYLDILSMVLLELKQIRDEGLGGELARFAEAHME